MFYRERTAERVDFAGELSLASRTLSGELWPDVHASKVQVQFLNIAALAELRLINSGNIVLRFGPQAGLKLSESFTGSMRSVEQVPPYREIIEDHQVSRTYFFQNDHRLIMGLGFRIPFGPYMALALDPYYTLGLSKLFIGEYPGRANEIGLRVGFSRRFHTTGFTNWLTRKTRRVPKEPNPSPGTQGSPN